VRLTAAAPLSRRTALASVLASALAGCAALRASPEASGPAEADGAPLLRLPPQALGRRLALQQQLTVSVQGQVRRQIDAVLEADEASVRLAVVSLGQTVARLEWDGVNLTTTRSPWLPAAVSAERILSDLQLVMWPAEAIRAALPPGWTLHTDGPDRVLRQHAEDVVTVRHPSATRAELVAHRAGYALVIDSRPLDPEALQ